MHADVNCAGGEEKLFITDGVAWAMISMMEGAGARARACGRPPEAQQRVMQQTFGGQIDSFVACRMFVR